MAARALLLLLPALSQQAHACAVCFGKAANSEGLFKGIGLAILGLIAVTMTMLAGIGATMLRIEKNRAAADRAGQ
jgi:hypothetical protein